MALSPRKEKILQAVVTDYIDRCEPVSSLDIHDKYFPDVSSATIRNDLATLEEMGYLSQPHVSAGRVPTADAYRLYVDKLLPKKKLTKSELKTIRQYINAKVKDVEDVVRNTAKVISEITNLTAVGYVKNQKSDIIKSVKIVKVTDEAALFIIVTDRTILKDALADIPPLVSEEYFKQAGSFMTQVFGGHTIGEVIQPDKFAKKIRKEFERIYESLINILKNYGEEGLENFAIEGTSKLLSHPEYSNVKNAKAMLELLDAKEKLYPILRAGDMNVSINIGREGEISKGLPECAIITASYSVGGMEVRGAGVIGPMRMDYSKVISVLDYIGKTITNLGEERDDNNDE